MLDLDAWFCMLDSRCLIWDGRFGCFIWMLVFGCLELESFDFHLIYSGIGFEFMISISL